MASTTSLFTGLSGLLAHQRKLDVVGNNIANVNTTAFKSTRVDFQSQITRDFTFGSPPSDSRGGTDPVQVGMGVNVAGVKRDVSEGAVSFTGDPRDLAVDGAGYFIIREGQTQLYTRDGSFRQDSLDNLVTVTGANVLGYGIDENFNIDETQLAPINIPVGGLNIAEETDRVVVAGNLDAGGTIAQAGSVSTLQRDTTGNGLQDTTGAVATAATLLTDIELLSAPGSTTPQFAVGEIIRISGAERGGTTIPDFDFTVTATSTVQDYLDELNTQLGIFTGLTNPSGANPGATIDAAGVIQIVSNTGSASEIEIEGGDIQILDSTGALQSTPFITTNSGAPEGESVRTTLTAFDSLGTPLNVDAQFTLIDTTTSGTTWRVDLRSNDNIETSGAINLGTSGVTFDTNGRILTGSPITVAVRRDGTGATDPLNFSLELGATEGQLTALDGPESSITPVFRDGLPLGTLNGFSVGLDGTITGSFTNGATRPLGRVPIATFRNPAGLVDVGGGSFQVGANSGEASVVTPGELASGTILGGSLEASNVDLGEEFIELIRTSTGYNASSRIIRTTDELIQQLLVLGR
ncbi:MAG: flagellar hook-basal body complex protein [Planctomycetota bacterium]